MFPAVGVTMCSLLDGVGEMVAELPVQAWLPGPDNECYPMIPLGDRLVALRPGVDAYELGASYAYE